MTASQLFRHQIIDERGVIPGALVSFRDGRAPGIVYTDPKMRIPGRNPMKANGRGVVVAYLPNGAEYEVTITRPDGSFVEQFQSTSIPSATVINQAAPEPEVSPQMKKWFRDWQEKRREQVGEIISGSRKQGDYETRTVEKVVYQDTPETLAKLEAAEKALQAAEAKAELLKSIPDKPAPQTTPDTPPEAIADLFQTDRPFAEQAQALWDRYNELTNKIMLKVATPAEMEKHQRLQGELDWIKRHAFEGV